MEQNTGGFALLDFDDPEGGILAYAITGKISAEALAPIWERFEKAHAEGRKIQIFADMTDFRFQGFELRVITDKAKHMGAILGSAERMAVVGDSKWLDVWAAIFDPITKSRLRHFTSDQRDDAIRWVREG